MNKGLNTDRTDTFVKPIKWCRYIINTGYATVAVMTLAHVIWFFGARDILINSPETYLRKYIILESLGLLALNVIADFLVRSHRIPLIIKEYLSLILFISFSLILCLTHRYSTVLLGTFVLSVFASTIFSDVKMTRRIFWISQFALFNCGGKIYFEESFNSNILMNIFVAWDMLICSYLLSKALIRNGQDNLRSLTNLYNQQQYMQEQLKLDPFTGLLNKKTFDDYLPKLIEECRDSNMCLSLAIIDVDKFKRVNDIYGHVAGDQILLILAQILKSNKTENISAFRVGGEEFAIIFKDYCVMEAYKICEGMRSIVESTSIYDKDKKINLTFSCGLACLDLLHTSSADLTEAADSALYKAKNNGRNNVMIYDGPTKCTKHNAL